jgi:hypothetical protein
MVFAYLALVRHSDIGLPLSVQERLQRTCLQ